MTQALPVWWALLAAPLAAVFTYLAIRYAVRRQLWDLPGERRSHQMPTPRGGGAAIILTVLSGGIAHAWVYPESRVELGAFGLGLTAVALVGWWDDHRPLSARLRLIVHVLASGILGWLVWRNGGGLAWAALAVVAAVSLVNIWNFMDGINGLAASQAALVAAGYGLLMGDYAWIAGVVALACLGFLPFNFPRARIFMGDVGSGALGYLMAGLLTIAATRGGRGAEVALLFPLLAFVGDAGLTLAKRMCAGEKWTEPHAQHLYQRLVRRGASHTSVTMVYGAFTIASGALMHYLKLAPWYLMCVVFVSAAGFVACLWCALAREER